MNDTLTPEAPVLAGTFKDDAWKEGEKPRFDATHRCDRCGAQAYVEAVFSTGTSTASLLFCRHDGNTVRPQLQAKGILRSWYTEADRLIENRSQGSEN
jgi:hypothetical protein